MRILFVSSEMTPYAKTGGLADVTSSLAHVFSRNGHDVKVVLPYYQSVRESIYTEPAIPSALCVRMGIGEDWCGLRYHRTEDGLDVYFVEHHDYFDRPFLYHDAFMNDYLDNPRRFAFLCRAALQLCMDAGFEPDIAHANDWQTALLPVYLKTWFWNHPALGRTASVLTIHNIAYQGVYPAENLPYIGIDHENLTPERLESHGSLNFLKGGIYFADAVNTVSPGHAREITTPYGGFGLAPYLSAKGEAFQGIINGIDYQVWNPEKDAFLPAAFNPENLQGKATCKAELQKRFGLDIQPELPLIGTVGRFAEQKGYHLLRDSIEDVLALKDAQFVILGSGDYGLSSYFGTLPGRYPGRVGSYIGYSEEISHLIEAGCDFFVMPSLYEPCGLNQMYSMRYGTLPIVRFTGGLADTVDQYDEQTGQGTGFQFHAPTPLALRNTMLWAISTYEDRKEHFLNMRQKAMQKDFSWKRVEAQYEKFYAKAIKQKEKYDLQA